jgi:hypothetical protein
MAGPYTAVPNITEVTDMPGLDRPTAGNYAVTFDDAVTNASAIFMVYVNEASAGNDDVHVVESRDGGTTWNLDSIINTSGAGRRYFPWICSTAGQKFVTWYDRRNSSPASPDLTAYYRSSVFDNGSSKTVGVGPDVNVSGVDDPQCAPGFPGLVRAPLEETQCTNLPAGFVPGGTCQGPCPPGTPGCGQQCDFRNPQCPASQTCTPGNGVPKYGDYNGAACALRTLYMA